MTYKILIYLLFFFTSSVEFLETKQVKIPLIIDADTANELDDLFAIARAISEPNFNILAINFITASKNFRSFNFRRFFCMV